MIKCPACDADVPEGFRFCGRCGHEVAGVAASQEEPQATQSVDEPASEGPPAAVPGEPHGQTPTKPSPFGWLRTTKGAVAIGIAAVLVVGGIIFGLVRHNALAKSEVAYTQAQADIQGGNLKPALTELQEVVSYDPNYQKAQDQIKAIRQAQEIVTIADNILRDSSKFDSDISSFWQYYNVAVDKTNNAWQDYSSYFGSSSAQMALQGIDATIASLGNDSSSIGRDVSSISADLGEAASNSLLKDSNTSVLLDSYKDSSNQANIISNTISDESSSLESGNFVYGSVPNYINTTNAAFDALQSDELKSDQGAAQFLGYAMGVVDKLLGQPIKLHDINNSQTNVQIPDSTTAVPPATSSLTTFNDSSNGIVVDVPSHWTKALITGGDYSGWRFINPADPNEEEIIVSSGCVGCYTKPGGSVDPSAVIPETNVSNKFIFNNGLSEGYTFYKSGNPYEGNGVVTVSTDKNGYGYVEVILPTSQKPLATKILNSFKLTL